MSNYTDGDSTHCILSRKSKATIWFQDWQIYRKLKAVNPAELVGSIFKCFGTCWKDMRVEGGASVVNYNLLECECRDYSLLKI